MELRRLLDVNLAALNQDRTFKHLASGKLKEAQQTAQKAARYAPTRSDLYLTYGLLSYLTGDKSTALSALQRARSLDPNFQKQFDAVTQARPQYKPVLDDQDFLHQLFPGNK